MITLPLVRLSIAADKIRNKEKVTPYRLNTPDELGQLTTIFFEMVKTEESHRKELQEAHIQVQKQNENLEIQVAKRTTELQEINEQLTRKIENQKITENKLSQSLQEKEVLLKEIHHRVKNNLQMVMSLLRLHSSFVDSEISKNVLQESEVRIRSMAMVHEKLYQSTTLRNIDLGSYIESLAQSLIETYNSGYIQLNLKVESFKVSIDTAIPCGLIVNELITNVLKHAFTPNQEGELRIMLSRTDSAEIKLEISDNGKGLPANLDTTKPDSLGLQLLQTLSSQINAEVDVRSNNGTSVSLTFSNHD